MNNIQPPSPVSSDRTIRFGLIGAGRHGSRYARHLAQGDVYQARLVGLTRRDTAQGQALADELGVSFHASVEELLAREDLDAVIVAVPVGHHLGIAEHVALSGHPLLLEKPFACQYTQAERISRAFAERNLALSVAHTIRFDPLTLALQAQIERLGTLNGFDFQQRIEQRGLDWEDQPSESCGGVVIQTAVHALDTLRFLTRATDVQIHHCHFDQIHYKQNEDQALVSLSLDTPLTKGRRVHGLVSSSKVSESRQMRYQLYFEKGALEADYIQRTLRVTRLNQSDILEIPAAPTVIELLNHYVAFLRGKGPNPVTPEDASDTMKVIEDIYAQKALQEG